MEVSIDFSHIFHPRVVALVSLCGVCVLDVVGAFGCSSCCYCGCPKFSPPQCSHSAKYVQLHVDSGRLKILGSRRTFLVARLDSPWHSRAFGVGLHASTCASSDAHDRPVGSDQPFGEVVVWVARGCSLSASLLKLDVVCIVRGGTEGLVHSSTS